MNQKTVLCCFLCFRIKSKTRDLVDWDKTKTREWLFSSFLPLSSSTSIFFLSGSRKHEIVNSNLYFKHIFIVFINFIFKKMVLQNGFSYYLFLTKFKYETYFLNIIVFYSRCRLWSWDSWITVGCWIWCWLWSWLRVRLWRREGCCV